MNQIVRRASRRLRRVDGTGVGVRYLRKSRHPSSETDDLTVADRVRSTLGSVTGRLDLPHVNVQVADGVVLLHGVVGRNSDAVAIERSALRVLGVRGVESYLHIGLTGSDTRPSVGHNAPSRVLQRLTGAARRVGIPEQDAPRAVRSVLATFGERIPDGERAHVEAHLPLDVRAQLQAPRRGGSHSVRSVEAFADRVSVASGLSSADSLAACVAVLRELRRAVPDEVADVAAVLPAELRVLWAIPVRR